MMIKACVIFNYNSYFRINLADNLKVRKLFQTLPYIVCRKPTDVLYIICNGQIIGSNPEILDHTLNMLGLAQGRCTIHMIFKIPENAYPYTHNDLLASYNALNYPEMDEIQDIPLGVDYEPIARQILEAAFLNPSVMDATVIVPSADRITEILEDTTVNDDTCVICSQSEEDSWVKLRTCGHTFHRDCITEWLSAFSTKCPVCDSDVR
jgi:hypothetical protein